MTIEEVLQRDESFRYQLLSRMISDCSYYLQSGGSRKYLWAQGEYQQIAYMKAIWDSFCKKPEWLTKEELERLETKITPWLGDTKREDIEQLPIKYVGKLVFYDEKGFEHTPSVVWFGCQVVGNTMGGEAFVHYDNALRPVFMDQGNYKERLVCPNMRNVSAEYDGCQLFRYWRD